MITNNNGIDLLFMLQSFVNGHFTIILAIKEVHVLDKCDCYENDQTETRFHLILSLPQENYESAIGKRRVLVGNGFRFLNIAFSYFASIKTHLSSSSLSLNLKLRLQVL